MKSTKIRSFMQSGPAGVLVATLLLAWLLATGSASAETFWVASGVGNWYVAANWSAGVPNIVTVAEINNGGTAQLFDPGARADNMYLGSNSGSSGTLEVSAGDAQFNVFLLVGDRGAGALRIINNGGVHVGWDGIIGLGSSGTGTATVNGTNSVWNIGGSLNVGFGGIGTLSVQNGGMVSNSFGSIGDGAGSIGTATVAGANSRWTNSDDLYVGRTGAGTLSVIGGGLVSNSSGRIADLSGSIGGVTVSGANSRWLNSVLVTVGISGNGILYITDGGTVSNLTGNLGFNPGARGSTFVDGPGSGWNNSLDLSIGRSGDGTLNITGGGVVANRHGFIGRLDHSIGTATVAGSNSRWTNSGDLNVGLFGSGDLTISGGGNVSSDNGYIASGAGSSGTAIVVDAGSVWTNINELAVGSSGAGALYITAGGVVSSAIGRIAQWTGSNGGVLIDGSSSSWNVSGEFTMGKSGMGTSTLILQNGGVLSAADGMTIGTLGTLRGDGTIVGNVLVGGGTIAPAGASPGTLRIIGNYTHSFNAKMRIELASPASFDKLAVTGNISLVSGIFGSALQVSLPDGYVPRGSQSFDILDWGGALSGTFLSIQLPTLGGTLVWDTSQLYTTGVLSVIGPAALAGDYNQNGAVDAADYTVWRNTRGSTTILIADGNGSGAIDSGDLVVWRVNFGATLGGGANEAAVVPEPATSTLLLIALASAFCISVSQTITMRGHHLELQSLIRKNP
ncbi:MAG: hypothetical protein WD851_03520 [Pirellulales bacterium]